MYSLLRGIRVLEIALLPPALAAYMKELGVSLDSQNMAAGSRVRAERSSGAQTPLRCSRQALAAYTVAVRPGQREGQG